MVRRGWRSGKITPQVVALVVLVFSVSLTISAYRSLRREFSGVVVAKSYDAGFSNAYWIYLVPPEFIQAATSTAGLDEIFSRAPRRRVGVSRIVHDGSRELQTISKEAFSPFVFVETDRYLDLGTQWALWGIIGVASSIFTFRLHIPQPKTILPSD